MNLRDKIHLPEISGAKPYWSPYVAGAALGLTLLLSFVLMGRGLGASGAATRMVGYVMQTLAPAHTEGLTYMKEYFNQDSHILNEYLVFMLAGVFIGGFVSGAMDGRVKKLVEKGAAISVNKRLLLAFAGGVISALGARLARGCTSGQALTGGATLAYGSWLFILCTFAGGYLTAYFVRKQWQ